LEDEALRSELAGQRPSVLTADRPLPCRQLDLGLLSYLERVEVTAETMAP